MNDKILNKKSRKLCSYILQDDNLLPNFTIQEIMTMAANLKISNKSMNKHDKQTLVSVKGVLAVRDYFYFQFCFSSRLIIF
jgi:ABC-type lipoprotein export system ATPase subunit